jgi:N utilization substance protein A
MKGSRVQSIIRELRGEKIDIIEFSDDLVTFAQSALAPARITRVSVTHHGEEPHLDVIVEDEQLSLAIGKRGQNVRLAAELLGAKVDIKSETDVKDEVAGALAKMLQTAMDEDEASRPPASFDILDAPGVGAKTAGKLVEAGLGTLEAVLQATPETLVAVEGVGPKTAIAILAWAGELAAADQPEPTPAEEPEGDTVEADEVAGVVAEEGDGFMAALSRALEEAETQDALTKEVQAEAIEDADREAARAAAEEETEDGAGEATEDEDAAEPAPAAKPDEEPVQG